MEGQLKLLPAFFALTLTWPVFGAVSLHNNRELRAVAQQAATQTYQTLTVAAPLVCSPTFGRPVFDLLPWPPFAGTNIIARQATSNVTPYVLSEPVVTISGRAIHIRQSGTYSGPPPPPTIYCLSTSADLGLLAAGNYDVTWELATSLRLETYRYSFEVRDAAAIPTLQWPFLVALVAALAIVGVLAPAR